MALIQLQGDKERLEGIVYEFDDSSIPLGEGGMGKVYRGKKRNLNTHQVRDVAIKFMFGGLPPNVIQRARDEASIHILSDNLVEMMGFLTLETITPSGFKSCRYHVVSELLIGVSLSDLMKGKVTDQDNKVIPYAQELYKKFQEDRGAFALHVMKRVLSGILALHDAGYIHRDLDPSNIMITQDRKIKIIDFGIAKKVDGLHNVDRNLTVDGQFMGKPHYAAPELIMGELKCQNRPTDIYALGVLFFQLVAGELPFDGPSNVVLRSHLHDKMPLGKIKDKRFRRIIKKATEKDYRKRFQSAAEFRALLDNPDSDDSGNRIVYIVGGIVIAVIAVVLIILAVNKKEETTDTQPIAQKVLTPLDSVRMQLESPATAMPAFDRLRAMAERGDMEAKYLESRIYATSNRYYTLPEQVVAYKESLGDKVASNPLKANNMLEEIVTEDPYNYIAMYDLACAYYGGENGVRRDLRRCEQLLDKSLELAKQKNDRVYVDKISAMLSNFR